jgi:hypothetical protein
LQGTAFRHEHLDGVGSDNDVGDARLGFWTGVVAKPLRVSLGITLGLPTGNGRDFTAQYGPGSARVLPSGTGDFTVEYRVALGYALRRFAYVRGEVGYLMRTSGYDDAFVYLLEVGAQLPWRFVDRFWLRARLDGVESFAKDAQSSLTPTGLGNGVTRTGLGGELSYRIVYGLAAVIGVEGPLRGRSVLDAARVKTGLSYAW